MHIRTAGAEKMLALWGEDRPNITPTAQYFVENMQPEAQTGFHLLLKQL